LDEPTAGVDPFARRAIWEMITKCKKGRSILIATHLMDEADILSDRIAVISHGQLRALGSPLFLKQRLGDGYFLTVVTEQLRSAIEGKSDSGSSSSVQKKSSGMTQEDHLFSQN
uniref:ABC transporter domain-containing protein n=1 Tax=Anisakis simplex TaxID=6269 RepID=A0A0M3JNH9_ANISI